MPIALLDDQGRALVLNDRFRRAYGPEALNSAALQGIIRKPIPDWQTVQVPGRGRGQIDVKAQVVGVQGNPMLILVDAADPALLQELDQLHVEITELERRSSTDPLTRAWNRGHFDSVAASELDRSLRFKQPVSLIFLDIDHFKQINDTCGHQAGDAVLRELVQAIGATIRSIDVLFRWGGEEYGAGRLDRLQGGRHDGGEDTQQGRATSIFRRRIGDDQPGRGGTHCNGERRDLDPPGG